jgi:hypothetical protein
LRIKVGIGPAAVGIEINNNFERGKAAVMHVAMGRGYRVKR